MIEFKDYEKDVQKHYFDMSHWDQGDKDLMELLKIQDNNRANSFLSAEYVGEKREWNVFWYKEYEDSPEYLKYVKENDKHGYESMNGNVRFSTKEQKEEIKQYYRNKPIQLIPKEIWIITTDLIEKINESRNEIFDSFVKKSFEFQKLRVFKKYQRSQVKNETKESILNTYKGMIGKAELNPHGYAWAGYDVVGVRDSLIENYNLLYRDSNYYKRGLIDKLHCLSKPHETDNVRAVVCFEMIKWIENKGLEQLEIKQDIKANPEKYKMPKPYCRNKGYCPSVGGKDFYTGEKIHAPYSIFFTLRDIIDGYYKPKNRLDFTKCLIVKELIKFERFIETFGKNFIQNGVVQCFVNEEDLKYDPDELIEMLRIIEHPKYPANVNQALKISSEQNKVVNVEYLESDFSKIVIDRDRIFDIAIDKLKYVIWKHTDINRFNQNVIKGMYKKTDHWNDLIWEINQLSTISKDYNEQEINDLISDKTQRLKPIQDQNLALENNQGFCVTSTVNHFQHNGSNEQKIFELYKNEIASIELELVLDFQISKLRKYRYETFDSKKTKIEVPVIDYPTWGDPNISSESQPFMDHPNTQHIPYDKRRILGGFLQEHCMLNKYELEKDSTIDGEQHLGNIKTNISKMLSNYDSKVSAAFFEILQDRFSILIPAIPKDDPTGYYSIKQQLTDFIEWRPDNPKSKPFEHNLNPLEQIIHYVSTAIVSFELKGNWNPVENKVLKSIVGIDFIGDEVPDSYVKKVKHGPASIIPNFYDEFNPVLFDNFKEWLKNEILNFNTDLQIKFFLNDIEKKLKGGYQDVMDYHGNLEYLKPKVKGMKNDNISELFLHTAIDLFDDTLNHIHRTCNQFGFKTEGYNFADSIKDEGFDKLLKKSKDQNQNKKAFEAIEAYEGQYLTLSTAIKKEFETFKDNWESIFKSEDDFNSFIDLITKCFMEIEISDQLTPIVAKKKTKTKLGSLLGSVHKKISPVESLKNDTKFLDLVRCINHFSNLDDFDLVKCLQR